MTYGYVFGMPGALAWDDNQRYNASTVIYQHGTDVSKKTIEFGMRTHGQFTILGANSKYPDFTQVVLSPEVITISMGSSNMLFEWPDGSCDTALSNLNYNCACDGAWYAGSTRTINIAECSTGSCSAFSCAFFSF